MFFVVIVVTFITDTEIVQFLFAFKSQSCLEEWGGVTEITAISLQS